MTTSEYCEGCGYKWDALLAEQFAPRLRSAVQGFTSALTIAGARVRPAEGTWSTVEYACHVRDVMLNLRDRILLGAIEDNPVPHRMFPDDRVALGLYTDERVETVAADLSFAAELAIRTVATLSPEHLGRPIFYNYPRPETRTLWWVASQMLHEAQHHLDDVTDR